MVYVYADNSLVYGPLVEGYELLDLVVTTGVNKAGTAEITMPPDHPAYNAFISYSTIVTIYRHGVLLFRGRALYPTDDLYGRRTITCEGERCFLRDGVMPPYIYQSTPAAILREIMLEYNFHAPEARQFVLGEITVTDPNNYIRFESESAANIADTIDELVERCGGYIVFTTNDEGRRVLNWYAELDRQSGQVIEFGENLLDFSRTGANTELATAIFPYGAKDEETGQPLTIDSVNNEQSYIQDDEAVALYGFIGVPVVWDDVTLPENLLKKAKAYLETSKLLVTTLELTAVDLSVLDRDIDTFNVGDWVPVYSRPHALDSLFMLRERTYHLLNPEKDTVVLGKDLATLTSLDAAGDRSGVTQLQQTAQRIKGDYTRAINHATASGGGASASVQSGHVPDIAATAASSYRDIVVEFPTAFAEGTTPTVVVGFASSSTAGTFGRCSCAVVNDSVSNTGFTLRFYNGDSSNRGPGFTWIAIG